MKLKIGDKVYLQKYEVAYIMYDLNKFPVGILQETFNEDNGRFFFLNGPADGFRFECVYREPENIEWLMAQDWIVDYDEYIEMPLAELEALQKCLKEELSINIDKFKAFEELEHKIVSLENLTRFRKHEIEFVFPDEYQGKPTIPDTTSTPQKKPGFFARLFGRSAP